MSQRLRVLVVDDNPQDRKLVLRELRLAFPDADFVEVIDQTQLTQHLQSTPFDLVVTDYHLQWSDGISVLRDVKQRSPRCPVIMFTATGNEEVAVEAMKHGLDDYIIKNVKHLVRLRATVQSVVEHAKQRVRAERLAARMESLLSQLNLGVFSCDPEGRFLEVNEAMIQLVEFESVEQATQTDLTSIFPEREQGVRFLQQVTRGDQQQESEIDFPSHDGTRCYRVTAKLFRSDLAPVMIDGLVEDVTQRKALELESRQAAVASARLAMLSPREREVFDEVVTGSPNKRIASTMHIAEKTVEKHRASLMRKLNARSVAELVRLSMLSKSSPK